MPAALVLVTESDAIAWTGRPGSTIRRWAAEHRITRHAHGHRGVRYNLFELAPRSEDGTPGAAPPLPAAA